MKKEKTLFICQSCGYKSLRWLGRCPDCGSWNSFLEELQAEKATSAATFFDFEPVRLSEVKLDSQLRIKTKIGELDRILGGGIMWGSAILIGGEPGIGKSTLLLQASYNLSCSGYKVLYISGEESVGQIKQRAQRLSIESKDLYILNQVDLDRIFASIEKLSPQMIMIDSIQVLSSRDFPSSPGTVTQVRECAGRLCALAKARNIPLFLIGHVTKEGSIAGPRILEHMVDTVLYFEGETKTPYRVLRAVKNRFGSTNEIGVFQMSSQGLKDVSNPSMIFLSERAPDSPGSVVISTLEGTRPLLVEVQALVSKASFGMVRRRSMGIDYNRASLLIAVMEKRLRFKLGDRDIFLNAAGGIKILEPAADLGIVLAIASSFNEQALKFGDVVIGEVGLAGEVRSINMPDLRILEAEKLGFKRIVLPRGNFKLLEKRKFEIELIGVSTIRESLEILLARR